MFVSADKMRTVWTADEVQVLLTLWADGRVQEQLTSTVRNERVFTRLSADLASLGFHKTASQCRFKVKKLKQEYKKVREQRDSKHRHSLWFAVMEAVLGQRGPEAEEGAETTETAAATTPESSRQGFPEKATHSGTI